MEYFVEFNSKVVSIECSISDVSVVIEKIFKDLLLRNETKKHPITRYTVDKNDTVITVSKDGECVHEQKNSNAVEVVNILMNAVKLDLIKHIDTDLVLHAALVSYSEKSILLPGNSGNGKSLATLGFLSLGCEYHTDEVVLINLQDERLTTFVRPLMVKPHGIAAAKQLLGDKMDNFILQGETINSLPVDDLHGHFGYLPKDSQVDLDVSQQHQYSLHNPPPIEAIVFPCYDNESEGEIVPLTPAQTIMELFKNNVVGRNLPNLGMSSLTQLVQRARGMQLNYSNYEQLPSLFAEIKAAMQQ